MCTVTIVPLHDSDNAALRIACNRDESRRRPAACPPQVRRFGSRAAILPVDPDSGGTWIAVNDAGLVMVLLNQNPGALGSSPPASRPSRGTIIPSLLHCDDLYGARRLVSKVVMESFAPFRLILADRSEIIEVSGGEHFCIVERPWLDAPMLFTSSGLGDALVEGPRRQLFQEWFQGTKDWANEQDAFHRHSWPEQQHLSVCMRRTDACTVSYTVVELRSDSALMLYSPQAPDESGPTVSLALELQSPGAA